MFSGAADVSLMRSALKCGQGIPLPEDDEDDIEEESDSMDESEVAVCITLLSSFLWCFYAPVARRVGIKFYICLYLRLSVCPTFSFHSIT
jgi:hypothetical protein